MFEQATRLKLRFDIKGQSTVEDLWDLSLANLDIVAKDLYNKLQTSKEKSFISKERTKDYTTDLKLDIVKRIIKVKLAEAKNSRQAVEDKAHNQKILGIIAKQEDEELNGLSAKELKKMLR